MDKEKEGTENATPSQTELKELHESLLQVTADFRKINDKADEDRVAHGEVLGEMTERLEKAEAALQAAETKLEKAIKMAPAGQTEEDDREAKAIGNKSELFWEYSRKGLDNMDVERKATMIVGDDATGGYLAPPEFVQEIIKGVVEFDPIRELAKVRQTSARIAQFPKRKSTGQVYWTGAEGQDYQETGIRYQMENLPVHEMSATVPVSNQDLEDSAFDLEGELRADLIEQFAVGEGTAFVSGNGGPGIPEGFLSNTEVETIPSGSSGVVTADGLIDLFYGLKELYAANATWLLQRATLKEVRKLKDPGSGSEAYVWQPGLTALQPPTILGAPYRESFSMPAIAADSKSIAVGDWSRGYMIADRLMISILRDGFTAAKQGVVEFVARKRVGAQVILAEAIKVQPLT